MAVMASRMNSVPESDLGVISATEQATQTADDVPFTEQSVTSDEPVLTDMPMVEEEVEVDPAVPAAQDALESEAGTEDGDS
jgi:hypothetical protein